MMMSDEDQARFNFAMLRLVAKTICQCFREAHGWDPPRGPRLSSIRAVITLTQDYGTPKSAADVVKLVRKVCHDHGLVPLGRN